LHLFVAAIESFDSREKPALCVPGWRAVGLRQEERVALIQEQKQVSERAGTLMGAVGLRSEQSPVALTKLASRNSQQKFRLRSPPQWRARMAIAIAHDAAALQERGRMKLQSWPGLLP